MKIFHIGLDETAQASLRGAGFIVTTDAGVNTPDDLYEWLRDETCHAVILNLDCVYWATSGVYTLRKRGLSTPVLGLSAVHPASWPEHRAEFLEKGGDEMLRNPPHRRELIASLRAIVRRSKGVAFDEYEFRYGDAVVRLNVMAQTITVNAVAIHFTGKEMQVFSLLAMSPGRVHSKEFILGSLYSSTVDEPQLKCIDMYLSKIRRKLAAEHSDASKIIETVRARGWKMVSQEDPQTKVA